MRSHFLRQLLDVGQTDLTGIRQTIHTIIKPMMWTNVACSSPSRSLSHYRFSEILPAEQTVLFTEILKDANVLYVASGCRGIPLFSQRYVAVCTVAYASLTDASSIVYIPTYQSAEVL
jgi:hypothetical protein